MEGRDIWSKICSCMDWLTVAVQGIKKPVKKENMNISSLEFTHFIVTIDMIVEAVNHLWLSIGQATNAKQPYINDRSIFKARVFNRDYTDEKYFKELRSWFGVHAVNGNEVELEGFNKGIRFFSSWSGSFSAGEFSLQLYSNNNQVEKMYIEEVDCLYKKEKEKLKSTPIKYSPRETSLKQIKELYQQAKERKLTREFYEDDILRYISFLSCDLRVYQDKERILVSKYLTALVPIISVYIKITQEVDDSEFIIFEHLNMRSQVYTDNHYDYCKVLEYAEGIGNSLSDEISLKLLIEKGLLPDYSYKLPHLSLSLLIHALDHEHNRLYPKKKKIFNYKSVEIIDDISDPPVILKVRKDKVEKESNIETEDNIHEEQ